MTGEMTNVTDGEESRVLDLMGAALRERDGRVVRSLLDGVMAAGLRSFLCERCAAPVVTLRPEGGESGRRCACCAGLRPPLSRSESDDAAYWERRWKRRLLQLLSERGLSERGLRQGETQP